MIGPWLIAGGVALVATAIAVSINTSMGGTRSDYNDGSQWFALFGLCLVPFGIAVTIGDLWG